MSNKTTSVERTQNKEQVQLQITDSAKNNLSELDLILTTSNTYFKPEPEKTYLININPEEKVETVCNPKFADKDGNIPTRFEFKIKHVNNNAEQIFTVSKTLCKQMATELEKGYTVLELKRHGVDRGTTYDIRGVQ